MCLKQTSDDATNVAIKICHCDKARRSLDPVRQLDGSWLSLSGDLEFDRRSLVRAETGVGYFCEVTCLPVNIGNAGTTFSIN